MDRAGFAKVSRWCRESNCFFSRKFNVNPASVYYGCHLAWWMPELQDCNVTFCESFAKVPRELLESWGWDLKGGALSFSQLPHLHTDSLPPSLSLSLLLSLSQSFTSLCHSLSVSLFLTPPLSLSLSHSCCLSVSISLSLSLFLFLLLNELVIRIMHGDGSAKVSRKDLFSREVGHFGNKEFRTIPTYFERTANASPRRSRQKTDSGALVLC